jgi:hypothetical protein
VTPVFMTVSRSILSFNMIDDTEFGRTSDVVTCEVERQFRNIVVSV